MKDSQVLVLLAAEQSDLQTLYFLLKPSHPDIAALVLDAGVKLADAIGRIATEKTVVEVEAS